MTSKTLLMFNPAYILLSLSLVSASELGELQLRRQPDKALSFVVRDPQEAVLMVESTVNPLSFEGNLGILKVDRPSEGEYRVHLFAGTNLITFKTDGYLPLRERFFLEAKSATAVRISPKPHSSAENRPELKLIYRLGPGERRISGSLDGRILNLDFASGSVVLRPEAGTRVVRLLRGGSVWEKSYDLAEESVVADTVTFPEPIPGVPTIETQVGGLYISSSIPSVKVFLNDLYQGLTPLTLDSVPAGSYELRLEKPLFQTNVSTIEVKPLDYSAHDVRLTPNFGTLLVNTEPSGASIQIEGADRGVTPLNLPRIDAGTYRIHLTRGFYADRDTLVSIAAGDTCNLNLPLSPRFGSLVINSDPPGATVTLDGKNCGVTPFRSDTLSSGDYLLTVSLPLYFDQDDRVTVADGQSVEKHITLVGNYGELALNGVPDGAKLVFSGEQQFEVTWPRESLRLPPGIYRVSGTCEGYDEAHDVIALERNQHASLDLNLRRFTGKLQLSTNPQGATIYVDGVAMGTTPTFLHEVPTGLRTIRIDKPGFDIFEDTIRIADREVAVIDRELSTAGTKAWMATRTSNTLFSGVVPGAGWFRTTQSLRGVGWLGLFAGALYLAFDAKSSHQTAFDDYNAEKALYQSSTDSPSIQTHFTAYNRAYDDMNSADKRWKVWVGAAVGVYALQLVDTYLFSAGDRPTGSGSGIELGADLSGVRLGYRLTFGTSGSAKEAK